MSLNIALAKSLKNCPITTASKIFSGRFRLATTIAGAPESTMDKPKDTNPSEKPGGVMSQSFGDGYSTRSDEEGFGGIYGGNQSLNNIQADKEIHANHPAYDKTQGSEVKEKEQARHQTNAAS